MLFLLEWTPSWFYNLIFVIGILGYLLTYLLKIIPIPAIYMYRTPIQIISVLILAIGSFLSGAAYINDQWLAKVKELEEKIRVAEEKSREVNVEIIEKVVYKDRIIKEKADAIVQYIDREIVKKEEVIRFVENCPLPKDIIDAHNAATIMNEAAKGNKK